MGLTESDNSNDWKAAILDADNLLDIILLENGYRGANLGERLKDAKFDTIDDAWEAHKIRNNIAHSSTSDVTISKRETKRVISLYSKVFSEFYYI